MVESSSNRDGTRTRIVATAAQLLRDHGPSAVTTRRVAEEAGVQAPSIYRLFGDKDGLLDAVAEHVMHELVAAKAAVVAAATADQVDPLEDLRAGWDSQVDFGLANPTLFRLLNDPERGRNSPAAQAGREVLRARVRRVAMTGRLRVSEATAVDLIQAAGVGAIQVLLATQPEHRDPGLADTMYAAVLGQILSDAPAPADPGPTAAAIALRAAGPELAVLSEAERTMLGEWLDRVIQAR